MYNLPPLAKTKDVFCGRRYYYGFNMNQALNYIDCHDNMVLYDKLNKEYRYMVNMKDEYIDNLHYVACSIRNQFLDFGYSEDVITDMLIQYLYGNEKPGVKELMEVQEERQELLSGLKEQKGRFYPYYRLRLFFYRGTS